MPDIEAPPLTHVKQDIEIERVVIMGHMGREDRNGNRPIQARAEAWRADLAAYNPGLEVIVIPTRPGGIQPNTKLFMEHQELFGKHTLSATIAGDGGTSENINAAQRASLRYPHIAQSVHLLGDGGTMCDTARSFNHRRQLARPSTILTTGRLSTIHLLELAITSKDKQETIHVMSYGGLGGVCAEICDEINGGAYRNSPLLQYGLTKKARQAMAAFVARSKASPITIAENGNKPQTLSDVLYITGPRMAGMYHGAKHQTEPGYHRIELASSRWQQLGHRAGQLLTHRLAAGEPTVHNTCVELKSDAKLHFDGETKPLRAGDSVTVRPGSQIRVLTTL